MRKNTNTESGMNTRRASQFLLLALALVVVMVVLRSLGPSATSELNLTLVGPQQQEQKHLGAVAGHGSSAIAKKLSLGADSTAAGASTDEQAIKDQKVVTEKVDAWNYQCWKPKTPGPVDLTIATVMGGLEPTYTAAIRRNRLNYAARHGYSYCELTSMDQHRIPAFAKLPWVLAMLPCTEFVIHVDADAQFYNTSLSLQPWVTYMQNNNVDQLLSADIITESPINYGIFMTRSRPWIWTFYKRLYNYCACDWGRTHDWPAEQGIIYDILGHDMNSNETRASRIVHNRGWNHILHPQEKPLPTDVLVHLTYPSLYPDDSPCKNAKQFTKTCKYVGLEYFLAEYVTKPNPIMERVEEQFYPPSNSTCQKVRSNFLFRGTETYANQGDAKSSSALDFDINPSTGAILGVKVGEVGCVGWRDKECGLKRLWDTKKGVGPWHLDSTHIGHAKHEAHMQ